MDWEVEVSDQFLVWYQSLDESEWESVNGAVAKLEHYGPDAGTALCGHSDWVKLPEHEGAPGAASGQALPHSFRFRPEARNAYMILGGDKTGDVNWYIDAIRRADAIYAQHLVEIGE